MPALSAAQRRILMNREVEFLGWDENNRPVVQGEFGIPRQMRTWALLRNGDPADIKGEVRKYA